MFDESLSSLIVPALEAKDVVAYVPAEPSHLFRSLENHFVLINQELSIEKIGSRLLDRKVISFIIRLQTLTKLGQFPFVA